MKFIGSAAIGAGKCRPPHGGRGLKLPRALSCAVLLRSPPARGAWVEIH